jgi:hypothetical protein
LLPQAPTMLMELIGVFPADAGVALLEPTTPLPSRTDIAMNANRIILVRLLFTSTDGKAVTPVAAPEWGPVLAPERGPALVLAVAAVMAMARGQALVLVEVPAAEPAGVPGVALVGVPAAAWAAVSVAAQALPQAWQIVRQTEK